VFRPSVINNFEGDMSTTSAWWEHWKRFMFSTAITLRTKKGTVIQRPCQMLEKISKAKYPAITEEEERMSVPLQLLCQAIFDAIMVHCMNTISPNGSWQMVKARLCERLYRQKHRLTAKILADNYETVDVICLQEAAAVFVDVVKQYNFSLGNTHHMMLPERMDGKRDQNSFILLRKERFPADGVVEVTDKVVERLEGNIKLSDGDLFAIICRDVHENYYLVVSFHGDTDGRLTKPVVSAVNAAFDDGAWPPGTNVILGLDANVYFEDKGKQTLAGLLELLSSLNMTTCWGLQPDPHLCKTTCSARTFLQPQLNKAVRQKDLHQKGDMNPKDLVVFFDHQFEMAQKPTKDNTGKLHYIENTMFPTPDFPSDHGILTAVLQKRT